MRFSTTTVSAWTLAAAGTVALCGSTTSAFAPSRAFVGRSTDALTQPHKAGCPCPACTGAFSPHKAGCLCPACTSALHSFTCTCPACARSTATRLYTEVTETEQQLDEGIDDVPPEVVAMDGIESNDEAHNEERKNNRGSLQKHKRDGPTKEKTPISELEVGSTVTGRVKTIASYGAFIDIGAQSDGLLHISRMSDEFVSDVNDLLKAGQEVEVRIASVDTIKGQVALSMMSEEAEANAKESQQRPNRQGGGGGGRERRDDSAVCAALLEKGWDADKFVEGEVLNTLDFGAFVKVSVADLNAEMEGQMDGLVHISALTEGRVSSVNDVVNTGDKVQVRLKGIDGTKVSLSMITAEQEQQSRPRRGAREPEFEGAKDWRDQWARFYYDDDIMPIPNNNPLVIDKRNKRKK